MAEAPQYRHDCSECVFLGRVCDEDGQFRDAYAHAREGRRSIEILGRYGDEPSSFGGPYLWPASTRSLPVWGQRAAAILEARLVELFLKEQKGARR